MKKTIRYVLFSFLFLSCFLIISNVVKAEEKSNIFDLIGHFELDSIETKEFNRRSENYNYTFNYDYKIYDDVIGGEEYIYDGSAPIITFYGLSYEAGKQHVISYANIEDSFGKEVSDDFNIYKYDSITQEFTKLYNGGSNAKAGTYEISEPGIYKLDTLISGIGGRPTYIIYEPHTMELKLKEEAFVIEKNDSSVLIKVNLLVRELKEMAECYTGATITVGGNTVYPSCTLEKAEEEPFVGYYDLELSFSSAKLVDSASVTINYNGRSVSSDLAYDLKNPELVEFVYMNANLLIEDFSIVGSDSNVLPQNSVARIEVSDDSKIVSAIIKYASAGEDKVVECTLDGEFVLCSINGDVIPSNVTFEIEDEYNNILSIEHVNTYDNVLLANEDKLSDHIILENDEISASFEGEEYADIDKICIFYGDEVGSGYECGYPSFSTTYYYKGTINVVVMDKALNYEVYKIEDVNFTNGYIVENYTYDVPVSDNSAELLLGSYINDLKTVACGDDQECKENIVVKAKYDELVEELEEEKLPKYLDILNKKFRDSTCVSKLCDKTVELLIEYKIGNLTQSLSSYFNYHDNNPYIKTTFAYQNNIELEYKNFDINSNEIKQALYGDALELDLTDESSKTYRGEVTSVFIQYIDRNGNVVKLDNLPYTSIATTANFGMYLLECRIKLIKNVTDNIAYEDEVYTKSFFINVELSDTVAPIVTLVGESEINVKQYGAYKDPGYKCSDSSTCSVNVSYYLNDENNQVQEIDTDVVGKYIVKYVAVDGDGNVSTTVTRIVNVESMNTFDTTSIIVIVSIVVVLAAIITVIVVLEVKKNKKLKEKEENI